MPPVIFYKGFIMRGMKLKLGLVCLSALLLVCLAGCTAKQAPSSDPATADSGAAATTAYDSAKAVIKPESGKLNGNILEFMAGPEGKVVEFVYGAFTEGQNELSGNKLTIKGGVIADSAYGAYTEGRAENNKVVVTGGRIGRRVEGGHGRQGSRGNELVFEGGSVENAYGGYSSDGPADDNKLVVRGGTIADDAQAGLSLRGSAANNTLTMEGGLVTDQLYGGYGMEGPATGNTAIVSGGAVKGDVNGAVSSTHEATGNTLILRGSPQIGGSVYGAFAVGEYGNEPDDVTGNKILLEGFKGALGDIWNAEQVSIDKSSRLANRERELNFYNCVNFKNDGVIALSEYGQAYLEISKYSGKGSFEIDGLVGITIKGGELSAPLRIKINPAEHFQELKSFDEVALVELRSGKFGKGLTADTAVQLLNNKVGDMTLRLRHMESGGTHTWLLSGE